MRMAVRPFAAFRPGIGTLALRRGRPAHPGHQGGTGGKRPRNASRLRAAQQRPVLQRRIRADLGMTAGLAAWWQHNRAAGSEVITVGAIAELPIPVGKLRVMHPVCHMLAPEWLGEGFEDWEDPGPGTRAGSFSSVAVTVAQPGA
jgi:hypothetical protein